MKMMIVWLAFVSISGFAGERTFLNFTEEKKNVDLTTLDRPAAYYEVASIEVEEVPYVENYVELKSEKNLDNIITIIDQLMAIGKRIWPIIVNNQPVLNTDFAETISVLPYLDVDRIDLTTLTSWSQPQAKSFKVSYKNALGANIIDFTYTVHFQHGGQYRGKGLYITGLDVLGRNILVSWGFKFNASSKLVTITNHGSSDSPTAGATVQIDYLAESVLRKIRSTEVFHVSGDGKIVKLN